MNSSNESYRGYFQLASELQHPLGSPAHRPYLVHYERVKTHAEWMTLGLEFAFDATGRLTQRKNRHLYRFHRLGMRSASEKEAVATGKRLVTHFFPMLEYVRVGVPFDDFISHPQHYRDFCLASLAEDDGRIEDAIGGFRLALQAEPGEVRYAERFYRLRVEGGDLTAPAEELAYFANEVDTVIHTERVYAWVKLLLADKQYAPAAELLRRTAHLLEDKIAGRLSRGRYSGDDPSFVAYKRNQFRKKLDSWARSTRYAPLMAEIDRQGGLPTVGDVS